MARIFAIGGTVALFVVLGLAYRLLARPARLERLLTLIDADIKVPRTP
jgi:hypothetical protein